MAASEQEKEVVAREKAIVGKGGASEGGRKGEVDFQLTGSASAAL